MTRMLMVDDDPVQLRSLARVFGIQCGGMAVVTASSGAEAIELLQSTAIDMVLTDVQMPDVNGLELIAWLVSHQPNVPILAMTAFPDRVSAERLLELGDIECFTKPIDVSALVGRVSSTLARGIRGHVRNISLAAFLQLLEMERKSCTLTIESKGQVGYLYIRDGALVDASTSDLDGEVAAYRIVSWSSPAITITGSCATKRVTVTQPMGYVIMEAMRLQDEEVAHSRPPVHQPAAPQSIDEVCDGDDWGGLMSEPDNGRPVLSARPSLSNYPPGKPINADVLAIVERSTGRVRTFSGSFSKLRSLAELSAEMLRAECGVVEQLGTNDRLEELVLTTARYWVLIRPLTSSPSDFAMLVFDPERDNVVMERLELDQYVSALDDWVKNG